jgi:Leucine-rich repeat (LRR) protein
MKKIRFILLFLMFFVSSALATIPEEEIDALDDLYQYTNGEAWIQNDQWDSPPCNRFGVICDIDETHVVGINLFGNNLQGSIPQSLKNLTQLQTLVLGNNNISGGISSAIISLELLTYLDLSGNHLSGNIPASIWQQANIKHLNLSDNQLSGELQINCTDSGSLQILNISKNNFSGNIPDCIGQMSTLSTLYLSDNLFSGTIPSNLSQLKNLNNLYLDHNQLEGNIPSEIGELRSLKYLRLNYNQLSGEIPDQLSYLDQLTLLDLSHNRLSGSIPPTIGNLLQLERLYLNDNAFSGILPARLGQCSQLEFLFVSSNRIQGPIPEEFLSLTSLKNDACEFRWNALWTKNASLKAFIDSKQKGDWLDSQTLAPTSLHAEKESETSVVLSWKPAASHTSQGSYEIYYAHQASGLFQLFVTVNNLQTQRFTLNNIETGVPYYFKMKTISLPHVNNDNRVDSTFSETIPISILSNFPKIERDALITLYESTGGLNWINQSGWMGTVGSECSWFGIECNADKDQVVSIHLASNGLQNELPEDIQNLSGLTHLDLRDNQLTGVIPDTICNLTHLRHLDLSSNTFSGTIPDSLGKLNDLEDLLLFDNQLSGIIPVSFGAAVSLKRLYLEKNHLTGTLPKELASLINLEKIRVHSNQFVGQLPDELMQLYSLEYGKSDFRWNGFYTNNEYLVEFLNVRQRYNVDWTKTQTVTPADLKAGQALDEGMELLWSSISYRVDPGYYEIYQATSSNGPFILYHSTSDKTTSRILLTDLLQNNPYYFRIRTCTRAHDNNSNVIESPFSPVITVTYSLHLPRISDIPDQFMAQNTAKAIPFTIDDDIVSANLLEIEVQSSNTGLIPLENISISGDGNNRVLHVSSVQNHVGETEITLRVKKNVLSAQTVFILTVLPEENPPPKPTGLHVVTGSGYVQLKWNIIETPYGVRYNVYRSTQVNGTFECIHAEPVDIRQVLAQDCFIDPNVLNGQVYVYKIKAELNSVESAFSDYVQIVPKNVSHMKGDINGDGIANLFDLVRILKIVSDIQSDDYIVEHMNAMGAVGLDDAIFIINNIGTPSD